MISVAEAFRVLSQLTFSRKEKEVLLWDARHHVLSETVYSPIAMPPFRQSNMDGFALCLHDSLAYTIVGEVKAGDGDTVVLQPGQAVKIFTGAAVPDTAQAVIQLEKIVVKDNKLVLEAQVLPETNVRPMGSQIRPGDIALAEGSYLNAAAIGFLAGLGFTHVKVFEKPKVGVVVTGNELVVPGVDLPPGKVYESNAVMLQAALYDAHFEEVILYSTPDDFAATQSTLAQAMAANDFVIVSGGISVGDYDFVGKALERLGVERLFYKVSQKPGKPLWVGKMGETMVFALPGNPAASLTCFYIHVLPTLQRFSGRDTAYETDWTLSLAHDYAVNNTRDQFLKASRQGVAVTILSHQDSSMLDSFALADVLVYLPQGHYQKVKGDKVMVYVI